MPSADAKIPSENEDLHVEAGPIEIHIPAKWITSVAAALAAIVWLLDKLG